MKVVHKAYDDNTAEVIDLADYSVSFYKESALIKLGKEHQVLGLTVSDNKINCISSYSITTFPTEDEAIDYMKDNGISFRNKIELAGMQYIFERKNEIIHVDYLVAYITEVERIYLADRGYTPYIKAAKVMTKSEAYKVANLMTHRSKTGKIWRALRIPVK